MSLVCYVGPGGNLLHSDDPVSQCAKLTLPSPMLNSHQLYSLRNIHVYDEAWKAKTIDITFQKEFGTDGYMSTLDKICDEVIDLQRLIFFTNNSAIKFNFMNKMDQFYKSTYV